MSTLDFDGLDGILRVPFRVAQDPKFDVKQRTEQVVTENSLPQAFSSVGKTNFGVPPVGLTESFLADNEVKSIGPTKFVPESDVWESETGDSQSIQSLSSEPKTIADNDPTTAKPKDDIHDPEKLPFDPSKRESSIVAPSVTESIMDDTGVLETIAAVNCSDPESEHYISSLDSQTSSITQHLPQEEPASAIMILDNDSGNEEGRAHSRPLAAVTTSLAILAGVLTAGTLYLFGSDRAGNGLTSSPPEEASSTTIYREEMLETPFLETGQHGPTATNEEYESDKQTPQTITGYIERGSTTSHENPKESGRINEQPNSTSKDFDKQNNETTSGVITVPDLPPAMEGHDTRMTEIEPSPEIYEKITSSDSQTKSGTTSRDEQPSPRTEKISIGTSGQERIEPKVIDANPSQETSAVLMPHSDKQQKYKAIVPVQITYDKQSEELTGTEEKMYSSWTIPFSFDQIDVYNDSLRASVEALKQCSGILVITGHTCNIGDAETNLQVGLGRADSVRRALIRFRILDEQIEIQSAGADQPVMSNATREGRQANRRVEISCHMK